MFSSFLFSHFRQNPSHCFQPKEISLAAARFPMNFSSPFDYLTFYELLAAMLTMRVNKTKLSVVGFLPKTNQ
jgi:hypothetical protein